MTPTPQPPPPSEREGEIQQSATHRVAGLLWSWGPVLVWVAVILALSSRSDYQSAAPAQVSEAPGVFFAVSKLVHVVEYSVLGLLLLRALAATGGGPGLGLGVAVAVSVLLAGLFGALDELRQSFVPGRTPRLGDIALDTGSALVATLIAAGLVRLRVSRPSPRSVRVERASP
ncbi:MAG TPA: VanZ family protein [Chloroflexota bacterium]|nr:VanZ family protein [Chloroflexota bacterium]